MATAIFWALIGFIDCYVFYRMTGKALISVMGRRKVNVKVIQFDNELTEAVCKYFTQGILIGLAIYLFLAFLLFLTKIDVLFDVNTGLKRILEHIHLRS